MKIRSQGLWIGLLVGAFGFSAYADNQKVVEVQSVQGWISKTHANWRAKESWVTRLSKSEIQRMLGVKKVTEGKLSYESSARHGLDTAAGSIDWRNMNGVNWLGPVMNQGNCGSCVAFATVASLEARTSIAAGIPMLRPTFSPQMLFACGGGGCDSGWQPEEAANFLQNTGVTDEACLPYTSGSTGADVACTAKCGDADSRSFKIQGANAPAVLNSSADNVKAALKNGPLVTTLTVYGDFVTYAGGIYKHGIGDALGGHAVSLVGYDDAKRAWLIRNSWGPEWGDNGFAWVSWDDESGIANETWGFNIAQGNGTLSVASPSDREYVSGQYQLIANSQGLKGQEFKFHLTGDGGRDAGTFTCAKSANGCSTTLDTTTLKEGRYEIYADGDADQVKSQVREFYVINSEPKMTLSFTPADGTDLSQPQNGRPEFNVTVGSSPVPMQHMEFRALNAMGDIVSVKSNDYVLPQTKMGWRTMTVPAGKYKILFHGETNYKGKTYAVDSASVMITVQE